MLSILFYAALLSATVPYAVAYENSWIAHMTYLKLCVGHILSKCESCYINDSNAAATHWNLPVVGSSIVLVNALCQVGDNCFQIWLSKRCPFSCNLGYMPEPVGLWGCTSITFPVDTPPRSFESGVLSTLPVHCLSALGLELNVAEASQTDQSKLCVLFSILFRDFNLSLCTNEHFPGCLTD